MAKPTKVQMRGFPCHRCGGPNGAVLRGGLCLRCYLADKNGAK